MEIRNYRPAVQSLDIVLDSRFSRLPVSDRFLMPQPILLVNLPRWLLRLSHRHQVARARHEHHPTCLLVSVGTTEEDFYSRTHSRVTLTIANSIQSTFAPDPAQV